MVRASWILGLSFIVLTVAFHTTGVVMMAFAGRRIRVGVEKQKLHPLRVILILIGVIGAVAVTLAVLHGLEAMLGRRHMRGLARSARTLMRCSIPWAR